MRPILSQLSVLLISSCLPLMATIPSEDLDPSVQIELKVPQTAQSDKVRVMFIGDSTVSSYREDANDMRGWGQMAPVYFDDQVEFLNAARSGASTKSFIDAGLWDKALEFKPDYVFIQFGHNDQKKDERRATDHRTTYRDNLRRFINDVRAQGGQPILVTSVSRRTFRDGTIRTSLTPWADAVIAVGREENVPVIDLHASSMEFFNQLGDEGSIWVNCCKETDRSHFSSRGAIAIAGLVIEELPQKVPALSAYLKPSADSEFKR